MYKYSETTDYIYLSELNYQNLPGDLVNITKEEVDIYLGNNVPSGKRRVKNSYPFVLEDIPQPSVDELFEQEIAALNTKHYKDVLEATNQYNIAVARDGSTEGEKVIAARANLADIDAQFELDQLAIINKYYGE
ncbi:hypothetical protein F353_gp65 [Vibrio phage CP-T1]|uniref:hypothetical protein n=1 Tax=Vibrio phage CP-T1 TaxID=10689 RepID=UPI0002536CFA|nr:hypothetical protein F353_gp65 [Vibrio phage CP-T1]AFC22447.1 hypothetical protein CP-T1_0065 [Vibrio phage CP-T1]AIA08699.1 hypothetical protein SBVc24_0010 [Vibrio phage 24]